MNALKPGKEFFYRPAGRARNDKLLTCVLCGAVVVNSGPEPHVHETWHRKLWAMLADLRDGKADAR